MDQRAPVDSPVKNLSTRGWRRFVALQRTGMGPVERAFFDEQHSHTMGTIRIFMVLGLMLWIIQSAMEYASGISIAHPLDVAWHGFVAAAMASLYLLYRPPLSSIKGHVILSAYAGVLSAGLLLSLISSEERWPYALCSFSMLTVATVALWTRLRWMFLGLLPVAIPLVYAVIKGLFPPNITPLVAFYALIAIMFGLLLRSGRLRPAFEVFVLRQHLMRKALLDPLTQVWNRAGWEARLDAVEDASDEGKAGQSPRACVLFMDLDHFKQVNDRHGHEEGDIVLRKVAQTIADTLRNDDVFARIGGEEFSAWLSGVDSGQALRVADRIRKRVAALKLVEPVTVSIGLSCVGPGEDVRNAVRRADEALFLAKKNGRNRVWRWGQDDPSPGQMEDK